jgi:hypothetical protein
MIRDKRDLEYSLPAEAQKLFNQLVSKMTLPDYNNVNLERLNEVVKDIVNYNIHGLKPFLRRLLRAVSIKEEWVDIRREGRFAAVLAKNGFSSVYLEPSENGPDIKAVYNGNTVYFEVTRRREAMDEWKLAKPGVVDTIEPDKTENTISRILQKHKQLQPGEINIVVLWSDTIGLDHLEMEEAFHYIQKEVDNSPDLFKKLSAVLFTTGGVSYHPSPKQFHLYININAQRKLTDAIIQKLETMTERDLAELITEHEALAASFKKLVNDSKPANTFE